MSEGLSIPPILWSPSTIVYLLAWATDTSSLNVLRQG